MKFFNHTCVYLIFFFSIFSLLNGCDKRQNNKIEKNINVASCNSQEIVKVIEYYKKPEDSLKLRAAHFLLFNMEKHVGFYYNKDTILSSLLYEIDSIQNLVGHEHEKPYLDSMILRQLNGFNYDISIFQKSDIDTIKSELLIENIEYAFKAWGKPWAKHLTFSEFCEWILPYRILDEPLQPWRKMMFDSLSWLEDSMKNKFDTKEACVLVNNYISKRFTYSNKLNFLPFLGGVDAWKYKFGICNHRYLLITFAMRSIGIPVAIDFTLQYPRSAGGHSWNVLLDSDGNTKSFNGGESRIKICYPMISPVDTAHFETISTVYRNKFAFNEHSLITSCDPNEIYPDLNNPFIENVTTEYKGVPLTDIEIKIKCKKNDLSVYLFSFGYSDQLIAVAASKSKYGKISFKNIGRNGIYVIGHLYNSKIELLCPPFIIPSQQGKLKFIEPDFNKTEDIRLYRKFYVRYDMQPFVNLLIGGLIQGANNRDFNKCETLYKIDTIIDSYREFSIGCAKSFRYYRYLPKDDNEIRIAELAFYDSFEGVDRKNSGSIYGYISDHDKKCQVVFENAFDNNIRTNFNAPRNSWIAIDMLKPVPINKFSILSRNDLNVVEPGDNYELFYHNTKEWKSLGIKNARDYFVEYKNVPQNTILLLRNLTKGNEERIFMIENGNQIWW
jgi:hypothetical protein